MSKSNKAIIKAINNRGLVYESGVESAIPEKQIDIKRCAKKISSAITFEAAFKALYDCMLEYLNSTKTTAAADQGWFRLFVELSHELRSKLTSLLREVLGPLSNRFFGLPPWERFLRIMCSLPLFESLSAITSMMDWRLFDYWSGAFTRMMNELGTLIGTVLEEVMGDLGLLPSGFDTESLIRFSKMLVEHSGERLALLCGTYAAYKRMDQTNPGVLGDLEDAFGELWDDFSTYMTNAGGIVLDSVSRGVSSGLAIIRGVGEWMQKNPGTVTLGVLIAIAIALTIASGGLAAPEAAAGLVWAAQRLRIAVPFSIEELTRYIRDQKIPEGV